jgi:uncharacterized protein (TIGR02284 family)
MSTYQSTKDVASTLNELIETCIDGAKGFEAAANAIDDVSLKNELMRFSQQRNDFAMELQRLVRGAGLEPTESGSVAGALHRGWIHLKDALSTRDRYAILAECERGEDSAVAEYRKATDNGLPGDIEPIVLEQSAAVQATHDRVKALRDMHKGT